MMRRIWITLIGIISSETSSNLAADSAKVTLCGNARRLAADRTCTIDRAGWKAREFLA